jgi:cobalt/nickel transport system permease protein
MKERRAFLLLALPLWLLAAPLPAGAAAEWNGVDKTVVEKFAHEAGRPPREPLINTDRGDLLLFVFLAAGAVGGFVAGYCYRALFPPGGAKKGVTRV